ncbi:hypothetical protein BDI4_190059 [Burkholderia diffusa]|nr:hypothetical protein BDI4_190059 [Burkholderia diffusa]
METDTPNQKCVADLTYIWAAEGWPFVAAVMVLHPAVSSIGR